MRGDDDLYRAGQQSSGIFGDDPGEIGVGDVTAIRDAFKREDPGVIQLQDIALGSAGDISLVLGNTLDDPEILK